MSLRSYIVLIISLSLPAFGFAQSCIPHRYLDTITSDILIYQDVYYATANPYGILPSQDLKLDFYEPFGDTLSKRPLIIFSFGGAFLIGDKRQPFIPDFCRYFAKRGYAVAAIDYRIGFNTLDQGSAERAAYRAVQDVRAALRFFAELSQSFRIDTNNIFLAGTSAGCVASLHSTFMMEQDRPVSTFGTLAEPDDLECANCSGNNRYGNRDVKVKGIINCWGAMLDTLYIGDLPHDSVPVISFHGTNDLIVPYVYGNPFQLPIFPPMYGSYSIHQRLNHFGIFNLLKPLSGAGHEPELLNWTYADTIFSMSKDFLYEIIQPKTSFISGADTACAGSQTFYNVTSRQGSAYCWSISGGAIISDLGETVEVVWNNYGTQEIMVKETNYLQAVGEEQKLYVQVVHEPQIQMLLSQNERTVTVQSISEYATWQRWDFGDGLTSSSANAVHPYASPGDYYVTLTIGNGYCSDSTSMDVSIEFCPEVDFNFDAEEATVLFHNQSLYTISVKWYFGDGDSSDVLNPEYTYSQTGTYGVTLVGANSQGCTDAITKQVEVQVTGVEVHEDLEFEIFPNPTNGNLLLKLNSASNENVKAQIFSMTGEKKIDTELKSLVQERLDLSGLSAGVYYLKIVSGSSIFNKRIVKL